MVSVSIWRLGMKRPLSVYEWDQEIRKLAARVASRALDGVGEPASQHSDTASITLWVRRLCSTKERGGVQENYLAIEEKGSSKNEYQSG